MIIKCFSSSIQPHSCTSNTLSFLEIQEADRSSQFHCSTYASTSPGSTSTQPFAPWGGSGWPGNRAGPLREMLVWPWAPGRGRGASKGEYKSGKGLQRCQETAGAGQQHMELTKYTQGALRHHKYTYASHTYVQLPTLFKCFKTSNEFFSLCRTWSRQFSIAAQVYRVLLEGHLEPAKTSEKWRWRQREMTRKSSLNVITFCPACCWQQVLVDQHTEGRSSSQLLCKQRQQQALLAQRAGMWPGTPSWCRSKTIIARDRAMLKLQARESQHLQWSQVKDQWAA